jgi:feruloyl esterase
MKDIWRFAAFSAAVLPAWLLFSSVPASAAAASCESLASLSLPHTVITLAQPVAAGAFTPPAPAGPGASQALFSHLPPFCRVAATLSPVSGSEIKIEVWLPATGWNGKLQSVGNGAFAGSISYPAMAAAVAAGYATASTDTGHEGNPNSAEFVAGHPEKLIDFAYRGVHEMTVAAKAIIIANYGNKLLDSYFNGCSTGGRQALMEAQRYPADYNGIIAGAAASYTTHMTIGQLWVGRAVQQDEASYIPSEKYPAIHKAVLAACDALDGVKDGVLENPQSCHFDPAVLECKAGDDPSCLTAPQVEAARKIYSGAKDPRTGQQIFPGLEPGSELGWGTFLAGHQPFSYAAETLKYEVFKDPKWDPATINFDSDVALADKVDGSTMNAIDPNLQPFFTRGGKLLMYHGWADPGIPPLQSVHYYTSVVDTLGGANKVEDSIRLFMVPGMGHCMGGVGTDTFDKVAPLDQWVTEGAAPVEIVAAHKTNGVVDRTRPLCPYPQVATYKGMGSTDDATSFMCKVP